MGSLKLKAVIQIIVEMIACGLIAWAWMDRTAGDAPKGVIPAVVVLMCLAPILYRVMWRQKK